MDASPSKQNSSTASKPAESILQTDTAELSDIFDNTPPPLFKSPAADNERKRELEATINTLKDELETQTRERDELLAKSGLSVEQARKLSDELIDRLHRYNDIKDAGQILFGKLAQLRGKTVKEMYKEYDVDLED
ncbi:swi5-like zinc finger protein [Kickxella alabastrina]|uniref:Swi5-like zinc finger protein n=1 Tax=Kickxella alabastrina TaxID=61397 RepID=A0ACC1IP82_9FUNG|nr:swi5-like zinc finger protein [Kickxella alabastrina]